MSIKTKEEFEAIRNAGLIVRKMLNKMTECIEPGITTSEINSIGADVMYSNKAHSAPMVVYGFPKEVCISVNDEIVHGIPGERVVLAGDIVKLDVVVEKDGFFADAAVSVAVPPISNEKYSLLKCAEEAFYKSLSVARAGNHVCEIGRVIENVVARYGFSVVKPLSGHGIGKTIHESPPVPNFYDISNKEVLSEGLVITIEPIITMTESKIFQDYDGWTIRTKNGVPAAHYEHTIVITKDGPVLLTAA